MFIGVSMDLMLATKYTEKAAQKLLDKHKILLLQEKYDGARVYVKEGKPYTRNNKEIILPDCELKRDIQLLPKLLYFDGELLLIDNEQVIDRKTGNGIINKALHGNCSVEESNKFNLKVFDIINAGFSDPADYLKRYDIMRDSIDDRFNGSVSMSDTYIVHDISEIDSFFDYYISDGKEGIMLKSPGNIYQGKRVSDILKRKQELTADLRVIGYEEGTGKYKGMLGALICETADGKLRVNVGTGFLDVQRKYENVPEIDSIVEVKYNAVIGKKDSDVKSLFLPVFVGKRADKVVANTLEEL